MQIRLKRKEIRCRIRVTIDNDGVPLVTCSHDVTDEEIHDFLTRHRRWLKTHTEATRARYEQKMMYDGTKRTLLHGNGVDVEYIEGRGTSTFDGSKVTIYYLGDREKAYNKWFSDYAKSYLGAMFTRYAHDVCPLRVRRMTTRFGECTIKKDCWYITLSTYLVRADDECVRCVIHHELTHRKVQNHSPEFYRELAQLEPNYREIERRLQTIAL